MSQDKAVLITDVALRDGHQSLIATRLRTEDMLPVCAQLDAIGFWSLEVWGGATFDACVRFLKEDPWERLRKLREALPNTKLQMLVRGQNLLGYRHYADDVVEAFIQKSADNGMDIFRVFDAMNDVRNLQTAIAAVKKSGKHAQGTLCYTTSPVHNTAKFVQQAKDMVAMGVDSIAIKDMAGLLTPMATSELVSALKDTVDVPLALHSHMTSGLAGLCQLKAIEAGIDIIDTAMSAFANGKSPSHRNNGGGPKRHTAGFRFRFASPARHCQPALGSAKKIPSVRERIYPRRRQCADQPSTGRDDV